MCCCDAAASDGPVCLARRLDEEHPRGHDAAVRLPEAAGRAGQALRVAHRLAVVVVAQDLRLRRRGQVSAARAALRSVHFTF